MRVNKKIKASIPDIVFHLNQAKHVDRDAFLGFDACIDILVRVVKEKKENEITGFFSESSEFGEFLLNLNNKSCGVELQTKLSKPGGNMVIMSNALGKLGVKAECVGTFGLPDILPVFRSLSTNCSLHTIGDTISATALEFNTSKVITFDPGPYNNLSWQGIKDQIGVDKLKELTSGKQLISFVNWSEIDNSTAIWRGFLEEIIPETILAGAKPFFFTDFSDCSRKSVGELQAAIELLGRFRKCFNVILSLNQNEADLISKALGMKGNNSDEEFVRKLYQVLNSDVLIIHRTKDALAYDGKIYEVCDTFYCKDPKILTGGGDNFNAGFCYTLFNGFSLFQSLLVANAVSGSYVKTGISPDVEHLKEFLVQESK